jgi:hypothetical protein
MGAITDLSTVINRATGGNSGAPENIFFWRDARIDTPAAAAATIAGRIQSLWQYIGYPSHGAVPGAVAELTNATQGSMKQTNPAGGRQKWLIGMGASSLAAGTLILYDRITHIGGLAGNSNAAQHVDGTPARYNQNATCIGNQMWAEIYTQIGTTAYNLTARYTNQAGTTNADSQSTIIGGTGFREVQRIIPIPLAAGDTGVAAIDYVTISTSTGTAGNFGVSLVRPLLQIPISIVGASVFRNLLTEAPGPIEVATDACLALAWIANGTTAPQIFGSLHFIDV